jgi:hypothetical protein
MRSIQERSVPCHSNVTHASPGPGGWPAGPHLQSRSPPDQDLELLEDGGSARGLHRCFLLVRASDGEQACPSDRAASLSRGRRGTLDATRGT